MVQQHHFTIQKTAKYCQIGEVSEKTKRIWFVLHAYGQLANYFIKNFESISDDKNVIISPEGLSRFYQKGFYGRVGASWMTKEDRLTDIEDYCNYLDNLYSYILQDSNPSEMEITVLGFSQGGATASRWLDKTRLKIDNLILWSSVFPNDLPMDNLQNLFTKFNCKIVYGTNDPFIGEEHTNQIEFLKTSQDNVEIITFNGEHKIDEETLINISK